MSAVIETGHLAKYYGKREIVRELSLQVPRGSIYGFLGRNGMGKTMIVRILLAWSNPRAGRLSARRAPRLQLDDRAWVREVPS